ncbi:MAG: MFS transporter [Thermoprotei archaeon]
MVEIEVDTHRIRDLTLTSLAHFINDGTNIFIPLIMDYISLDKSVSPIWITLLLTIYYLTSTLLSTLVGRLADRSGRPGTLISLGLALLSIGLLGFYYAIQGLHGTPQLLLAAISSATSGLGSAFYHPLGATILSLSFGEEKKGRALGVNGAMGSLGRTLYPSLFFVLAAFFTKPGTFAFFGLVGLAAAFTIFAGFRGEGSTAAKDNGSATGNIRSTLTRGIVLLSIIGFLRSIATQGVVSWIPIYFTHDKGLGFNSILGVSLTLMYAAGIVGQLVFGLMVERFEKRGVLAIAFLGSALSLLGFLLSGGYISAAFLFFFGFFTFSGFPLFLSLAGDYAPRGSSSVGNALVWGVGISGGNVLAPIVAAAISAGNYSLLGEAFLWLAVMNIVITPLLLLLPKLQSHGKVNMFG